MAKSGFEDIEHRASGNLKKYHSYWFLSRYDQLVFKSKEDYYYLASNYKNDGVFKNDKESSIWGMHADGSTYMEIGDLFGIHFTAVAKIIKEHQNKMKELYGITGKKV